ncbi:predicted protein, partial [Nematostella vectensis]
IPGPNHLPFIGTLIDTIKHGGDIRLQFAEYSRTYGRVYGLYLFGSPTIVINDPDILKEVLVKEFHSFHDRPAFFPMPEPFDSMMFFAEGETWHRVRTTVSPIFSAHKMKMVLPLMNNSCDIMMSKLQQAAEKGEPFNMYRMGQSLTMDFILRIVFGIESSVQHNYDDPAFVAARSALEASTFQKIAGAVVGMMPKPIKKMFSRVFFSHTKELVEMTEKVIAAKKTQENSTRKDILDLMLEAMIDDETKKKRMTEAEIIAQCLIFMIAGYEGTNSALTFICYNLATNPDIQEKLQQEIDSVWTDADQVLSYDILNELSYLDMVVSETLRMYPPGMLTRAVTQDCVIQGRRFRKGNAILMDVYSLHHDPELWPEPERFNPERFTAEAKQSRNPCAYLPFSAGPRNCVGMRFSLMELKLALTRILKKYSFAVTQNTKIPPTLKAGSALTCGGEMMLGVKARE